AVRLNRQSEHFIVTAAREVRRDDAARSKACIEAAVGAAVAGQRKPVLAGADGESTRDDLSIRLDGERERLVVLPRDRGEGDPSGAKAGVGAAVDVVPRKPESLKPAALGGSRRDDLSVALDGQG